MTSMNNISMYDKGILARFEFIFFQCKFWESDTPYLIFGDHLLKRNYNDFIPEWKDFPRGSTSNS
jgi:hypothetical protein